MKYVRRAGAHEHKRAVRLGRVARAAGNWTGQNAVAPLGLLPVAPCAYCGFDYNYTRRDYTHWEGASLTATCAAAQSIRVLWWLDERRGRRTVRCRIIVRGAKWNAFHLQEQRQTNKHNNKKTRERDREAPADKSASSSHRNISLSGQWTEEIIQIPGILAMNSHEDNSHKITHHSLSVERRSERGGGDFSAQPSRPTRHWTTHNTHKSDHKTGCGGMQQQKNAPSCAHN